MAKEILSDGLPEGWESRTVKECLDGKSYSVGKVQTKEYWLVGKFPIIDQSQKAIAGYCDLNDLAYNGKLPVLIYWDHTNSVKYVDFQFVSWADGTKVLNPREGISAKYFFHAISTFKPETRWYRRHFPILKDVRIPVPPLPEQERIVAKLDGIFEHIDASIKLLEQNIADADTMAESVLDEAFNHGVLPEGWEMGKLWDPDVVKLIMGQSPDSKSYNSKGEWLPFYQGKKEFWELYPAVEAWCTEPKKIAEAWDVLLSVRAPVGPTNICQEKSCIGRWLWAVRANPKRLNGMFLLHFFRAFESKLAEYGKWSTFPAITKKELENFKIPLPPLSEQERIVAKLDAFFSEQKAIKSGYETKISELKALKSSILSEAFQGKI